MKKRFMMFTLLATAFSGMVHADDAAIRQSLAKLGVQSTEIQPAPVAGMKTVLTNSGVLYVTEDGKHIIQGPMYDVSGASPVNVTNQLAAKTGTPNTGRLIVGDFSQLIVGEWGSAEILANPYAAGYYEAGAVQLRILATMDMVCRNPKAFVAVEDIGL